MPSRWNSKSESGKRVTDKWLVYISKEAIKDPSQKGDMWLE